MKVLYTLLTFLLASPLAAGQIELTYEGNFYLPAGRQPSTVSSSTARFGYGGQALALSSKAGHLWVSGHPHGDLVAEVKIPAIGATANITTPFLEVTSSQLLSVNVLDSLVGLAVHNGRLHALWQQYYDVDGKDGGRKSLWNGIDLVQIGDGSIKKTSGYLTVADGSLWCGRSSGAGNAGVVHGASLFQIMPDLTTKEHIRHVRDDWTAEDQYTAISFLPDHVCWLVRHATGPVWYGTSVGPNGEIDPFSSARGYHTTTREVWLLPYSWPGGEPQDVIPLPEFYDAAQCRGMVYDDVSRRLFIVEGWPPKNQDGTYAGEKPKVHVYKVGTVEAPPPEPEPEPDLIDIEIKIGNTLLRGKVEKIGQ